jgi:hypothetical protein
MISTDTDQVIESELIDLSSVSLDHLRALNSSALHQAMRHVLERTSRLRGRRSSDHSGGERID